MKKQLKSKKQVELEQEWKEVMNELIKYCKKENISPLPYLIEILIRIIK